MKTLRKRTKIEAIGLALLILALSIGSVLGTTILKDPSGTTPGNGFVNPTYIWNSNGQCWVATATNLQTSLNLRGTTFLPASTITINFTITIPSNTSLIGRGWQSIIKAGSGLGDNNIFENEDTTNGNDHIEIRNLQIDGNDPTHLTDQYAILYQKVNYGLVDNVYVHDTGKDGVRGVTVNHTTFSFITADNTGHHAVMLCYGSLYSSITDCILRSPLTESAIIEHPNAVTGIRNQYCTIDNVIAEDCEQIGFYIADADYITVSDCITKNSNGEGFYVRDGHDITLTNCITYDNDLGCGIDIEPTAEGVTLSNCISRNAGEAAGGNDAYGLFGKNISLSNSIGISCRRPIQFNQTASKNITISLCQFKQFANFIIVRGDNIILSLNTFADPTASLSYIIYVDTLATNVKIVNNDFRYAPVTSRRVNDGSTTKAIVRDNFGFPTDYLMRNGGSITVGLNGAYSTALSLAPMSRRLIGPMLQLKELGFVGVGETITIKVEAVYYSGITKAIERTHTTSSYIYNLTYNDWFSLANTGVYYNESLVSLNIYGKTTNASTSAAPKVYFMTTG